MADPRHRHPVEERARAETPSRAGSFVSLYALHRKDYPMSVLGPDSPLFKKEPSKRGQWLVHHPYILPFILLVTAPTQQFLHGLGPAGQWAAFALSQLFVLCLLYGVWANTRHMLGFCDYCFHQPAGGPAVAKKHMRQLRIHHLRADHIWIYSGLVMITYIPVIFLRDWAWVGYIIAFFFLSALIEKASQVHAWLVPWCPWCKDDGRWQEPSPVPDPSMTKQHV